MFISSFINISFFNMLTSLRLVAPLAPTLPPTRPAQCHKHSIHVYSGVSETLHPADLSIGDGDMGQLGQLAQIWSFRTTTVSDQCSALWAAGPTRQKLGSCLRQAQHPRPNSGQAFYRESAVCVSRPCSLSDLTPEFTSKRRVCPQLKVWRDDHHGAKHPEEG